MKRLFVLVLLILCVAAGSLTTDALSQEKPSADPPAVAGDNSTSGDDDHYVIGPEDVLHVFVWKEESLTQTVPVRIDGRISLPLLDDIQAAGLTPLELKGVITEKLRKYVENPTVTVTVREANSYKIFITGEVRNPGVMRIRSETSLLRTITAVGGFTEWANKRSILIITRDADGNEKRATVNYNRIVSGRDPDPVIRRGDTIVVR